MRVLVTSSDKDLQGPVDPRFGRAKWFVVVDTESGIYEATENAQNLRALQGAGIQAAENAGKLGVECVLTGHVGPKAFRVLTAAGIRVFTGADGTVLQALEKFKKGELEKAAEPDVEGHWG
jgi:predicted Fe-Mo cluster-binding NifX family protein